MSGNASSTAARQSPAALVLEPQAADPPAQQILAQAARALLALGRTDLADALAVRALAEDELFADVHSGVASILDPRGDWHATPRCPPRARSTSARPIRLLEAQLHWAIQRRGSSQGIS